MSGPNDDRPVDQLVPGRRAAIGAGRCMARPIGCGLVVDGFDDDLSAREFSISGLCQRCQNLVFLADDPDDQAVEVVRLGDLARAASNHQRAVGDWFEDQADPTAGMPMGELGAESLRELRDDR